jgi:hypothetical protein
VLYCGAEIELKGSPEQPEYKVHQSKYIQGLREPDLQAKDLQQEVRTFTGAVLWPAQNTSPHLCVDCSWIGIKVTEVTKADLQFGAKVVRRARHFADVGLTFSLSRLPVGPPVGSVV